MSSKTFLILTINSKKIKKINHVKLMLLNLSLTNYCNFFYLKHLTFIDIVDQNTISKTMSKSKNMYYLRPILSAAMVFRVQL